MRLYLDNCCYNRPYDDQDQLRIFLESQAKLAIQSEIRYGRLELAVSYWSFYENSINPSEARRRQIYQFLKRYATVYVSEALDDKVRQMAFEIEKTGVKHKDACHVACAIISHCEYLITTDDRLLKYKTDEIELINPITMINVLEEKYGNDNY